MKNIVIIAAIAVFFCFASSIIIPKLEAKSVYNWETINAKQSSHIIDPLLDTKTEFPYYVSFSGIGKNINFAEDAQSIVVIYSYYSFDNLIFVAFTNNFGRTWKNRGPFNVLNSSLSYCCLDAEPNWPQTTQTIHFAHHEEVREHYPVPASYFKGFVGQDTWFTPPFILPNSEASDAGSPCIGIKDSFVIITKIHTIMTWDCYIWRSTNYGETWDNGRVFIPGPVSNSGPYFRFGNNGYIFFLWVWGDNISQLFPYYCESFDYGLTWTQPQLLWQNSPPNPNATCLNRFDCEVVRDTPVVTVGLYIDNYTYNEIWVYRPDSGGPGNWRFNGTKLFGDSTSNQLLAGNPNVAADDSGNVFIGYFRYIINSGDTIPNFGLFARPAPRDTWYDWDPFIGDTIGNGYVELANNAPLIAEGDSTIIAILCTDIENFWVDHIVLPNPPKTTQGITGAPSTKHKQFEVKVSSNPFRNSVKFIFSPYTGEVELSIYDVTGKLIRVLTTENKPLTTELVWDGRKSDGSLVNSGIYFYNLSSGGNQHKGKVILTR